MVLRLFENVSMRHEMRRRKRTVSESILLDTQSVFLPRTPVNSRLNSSYPRNSDRALNHGIDPFEGLGKKPQVGMTPIRADERETSALIHIDMFRDLRDRAVVLADLSLDNPNVFYELGIRRVMSSRDTVLICRKNSAAICAVTTAS